MDEQKENQGEDYPRGRGYGHDYMRGGEVFGGYGYSMRRDYERPRGEKQESGNDADGGVELAPSEDERIAHDALEAERLQTEAVAEEPERFPQDERAGGWEVPHDLGGDAATEALEATAAGAAAGTPPSLTPANDGPPPVPQLERTFGDSGGNRLHSRSYYVTQAQLQQRFYAQRGESGLRGQAGDPIVLDAEAEPRTIEREAAEGPVPAEPPTPPAA